MRQRRLITGLAVASALVVSGAVAGCSSGSGNSGSTSAPAAVSTAIPSGHITLTLATEDTSGLTQSLVQGFEKLHPNVTINIETTAYTAYTASVGLRLASSTPPDLSEAVVLGNLVKQHLLLDLDKYAALYHWTSELSPYSLAEYRMGANLVSGSGPLYAVSSGFDLTGLYYNKKLAAQLGISGPPATLAELDADLAKAKKAGITGIEVAANDGHGAYIVQQVADDYDSPTPVNNWIFGAKGATFGLPGITNGVNTLVSWAKSGYINSTANSYALTQALAAFNAGQALFFNDGNWDGGAVQKALGSNAGFAVFPAATAGGRVTAMVGGTAGYQISAQTKYPNVAAAFLNYTISPQAASLVTAAGDLPNEASAVNAPAGSLLAQFSSAWQAVEKSDGLYGWFANAYDLANTTLTQTTEELIGGSLQVPSFVSQVQSAWAQAHQS